MIGATRRSVEGWARTYSGFVVDLGITTLLVVIGEVSLQPDPVDQEVGPWLTVLLVSPVLFRRLAPVASLLLLIAGTLGTPVLTQFSVVPSLGPTFAILLGIGTVAAFRPRAVSLAMLAAWLVLIFIVPSLAPPAWGGLERMLPSLVIVAVLPSAAAWVGGDYFRRQSEARRQREAQAQRIERERDEAARAAIARERARQAAARERARLSRELHDVIAHDLSVMVVQAAAAQRILADDPAEAQRSITTVEETGRKALTELRRLLGVVRKGDRKDAPLAPQPGVEELQPLVESVRAAGIDVELRVTGRAVPMSAGMELTVYRIVQEALTNVIKHAGAKQATVELNYGTEWLTIVVVDNGVGARVGDRNDSGYGLLGLRERVGIFGGEFSSGSVPGGEGFRLTAKLPRPID